jgi:hypothetical protein
LVGNEFLFLIDIPIFRYVLFSERQHRQGFGGQHVPHLIMNVNADIIDKKIKEDADATIKKNNEDAEAKRKKEALKKERKRIKVDITKNRTDILNKIEQLNKLKDQNKKSNDPSINEIINEINNDIANEINNYVKINKEKNIKEFGFDETDLLDDDIAKANIGKMFNLKMLARDETINRTKFEGSKNKSGYENATDVLTLSYKTNNNIVVIKAGTGTGKSTILASILLTEYNIVKHKKKTLILSPRITNVEGNSGFVSKFFGVKPNTLIGYKHKNVDKSWVNYPKQKITFITQESFLNTLLEQVKKSNDKIVKFFDDFSLIILDEAHENTIVNELLFFIFKQIRHLVCNKVTFVILSATIEPLEFVKYFYNIKDDNAADTFAIDNKLIVDIEGVNGERKKYYLKKNCNNLYDSIVSQIDAIITGTNVDHLYTLPDNHAKGGVNNSLNDARDNRDIIVFVPGQSAFKEIIMRLEKLEYFDPVKYKIVKVYRDQPLESEKEVTADYTKPEDAPMTKLWDRRIYLATTKAETGVTFPNMKYVIDTGLKNSVFHDSRIMADSKLITAISVNNVLQREGRVARSPGAVGIVYCMYTKEFYDSLSTTDIPALLTENFEGYFFQMLDLCKKYNPGGNIYTMNFRSESRHYAPFMNYYALVNNYGLIDNPIAEKFTHHRLPIQTLAMICKGVECGTLREMLIFSAAAESPFYPEMNRVYNEAANSYEFLGTIMPKIYFFSEIEKWKGHYKFAIPTTVIDPYIKKLINAGKYTDAKAFDTSENKIFYQNAMNYYIIRKFIIVKPRKSIDDLRNPADADFYFTKNIIEKFFENYNDLIKDKSGFTITPAQSWKNVYKTIKDTLILNRATNYYNSKTITSQFDNIHSSKNLFVLPNGTFAIINPDDLKNMNHVSHKLFVTELFYTKTIIAADGSQQFAEVL